MKCKKKKSISGAKLVELQNEQLAKCLLTLMKKHLIIPCGRDAPLFQANLSLLATSPGPRACQAHVSILPRLCE